MSEYWSNKDFQADKRRRQVYMGMAGKGDKRRPTNESAYQLGMKLIRIADEYGKESTEYKQAEKAWRNAVKKGL